jgi:hypothetical protein
MREVFRVINQMVDDGIIPTYAIGGAIGATFYVEPFATTDVDVFIPVVSSPGGLVSLAPIYQYLTEKGYQAVHQDVDIEGWYVQFLPINSPIVQEAVDSANVFDVEGIAVRVMPPEHLALNALTTGRPKDLARVQMFLQQGCVTQASLLEMAKRFKVEDKWQKFKMMM